MFSTQVAEFKSTGERLRCYYNGLCSYSPQQVCSPWHLSLVGDGRLLVVDAGAARRVLMLNSELKLERVLLTRQQLYDDNDDDCNELWPDRLCYNSQTGLLFVGIGYDGNDEEKTGRVRVCKIT